MSEWNYRGDYSYKGDITGSQGPLVLGTGLSMGPEITPESTYAQYAYELRDIAQSHHFTITLSKIKVQFPTREFGYFLPVKNISYTQSVYENMTIPVGIFGDFPILKRKQVSKLSMTLYDIGTDPIEDYIRAWENECYPKGKYVNYLSQIVGELVYTSFSPDGKRNKSITMYVIPSGSYQVSRSYEENNAKLITFGVVVVGFKGTGESSNSMVAGGSGVAGGASVGGNLSVSGGAAAGSLQVHTSSTGNGAVVGEGEGGGGGGSWIFPGFVGGGHGGGGGSTYIPEQGNGGGGSW